MNVFKIVAGVILTLATLAAGVFIDVVWLLVGGIKEIAHGIQASPVDGGQIGWGIAHVAFSGAGMIAAFLLCWLWWVILLQTGR